jgi:hypothetical protein
MFSKNKVSQSMIDAVNQVVETAPIKEPTPTGMRVFGGSYGNSAKAKQDQTRSSVDDLKEPTKKDIEKDSKIYKKTPPSTLKSYNQFGAHMSKNEEVGVVEAAKPDFLDMDGDKNEKESMKKAIADKKSVKEELKGNQHKIDANNNNKIDAQDFKILKGKKKVSEDMHFAGKLLETVRKSDVPAFLRKAKGDTPLTMADAKGPKKDSISDPKNLAKARNEEVELDEENYKQPDDAPVTTDTLSGRMPGGKMNSFKSYKLKVSPLDKEGPHTPNDDTPKIIQPQKTPAMKSHEVHEATIAGTSGWEPMKKDAKDKSGAVHTPMSRARDLAKSALKRVQDKTKIK